MDQLSCLCVRAPYAGQIVDGLKTEEYRSRPTKIRGRVGIVQSKTGTIIGEVTITGCKDISGGDGEEFAWQLADGRRYKKPIPYQHPNGAVVWVKVSMPPPPSREFAAPHGGTPGTANNPDDYKHLKR